MLFLIFNILHIYYFLPFDLLHGSDDQADAPHSAPAAVTRGAGEPTIETINVYSVGWDQQGCSYDRNIHKIMKQLEGRLKVVKNHVHIDKFLDTKCMHTQCAKPSASPGSEPSVTIIVSSWEKCWRSCPHCVYI